MGAFLRQLVALSALWALSELLLNEGSLQRAARLCLSLLTMTVLVATLLDLAGQWSGDSALDALGNVAWQSSQGEDTQEVQPGYAEIYLRTQANQAQSLCLRMARRAGYEAACTVYVRESGGLERIELRLSNPMNGSGPPLISAEELRQSIIEAFAAGDEQVKVFIGEGG